MDQQQDQAIVEMSIDKMLPAHLWTRVFSFLPRKHRKTLPEVSTAFYEIICSMERFKWPLVIRNETIENDWILVSKRKFRDVHLNCLLSNANLDRLMMIMSKHGATIEKMTISTRFDQPQVTLSAIRLKMILGCVPNLKHLEWSVKNVTFDCWFEQKPVLERLQMLEFRSLDKNLCPEFALMFPANTIKHLEVCETKWLHLKMLIERQSEIKKLEISSKSIQSRTLCQNLELDEFRLIYDSFDNPDEVISSVLAGQQKLKKFTIWADVKGYAMSRNLIRAVLERKHLQVVFLVLEDDNLNEIHRLAEFKDIKELNIGTQDVTMGLMELASIPLPTLERFTVEEIEEIEVDSSINQAFIEAISVNWPNLKQMKLKSDYTFHGVFDSLNEILDKFQWLETLKIHYSSNYGDEQQRFVLSYFGNRCQYPHLKVLKIKYADTPHFQDLIDSLPNLKELTVRHHERAISYTPALLHRLAQLKHLKKLKLDMSVETLSCRFREADAVLLLKLCRKLDAFEIDITSQQIFSSSLQEQMAIYDHTVQVNIQNHANNRSTINLKHAIA